MRPGYADGAAESRARQAAGLRQGHRQVARGGQEAARGGRRQNLKFKLLNRNVAEPYTPGAVYSIDQWRRIGVTAEHEQFETARLSRTQTTQRG